MISAHPHITPDFGALQVYGERHNSAGKLLRDSFFLGPDVEGCEY